MGNYGSALGARVCWVALGGEIPKLNNIGIMLLPCGIFSTAVCIAGRLRIPKNVSLQWYALFFLTVTQAFAVPRRFEILAPMPL